ncbi:MAG: helix-turn-helix domain-containing protein [Myxococcota bacterium]
MNIENVGLEKARTRLWSRLMLLSVRYSKTDETTGAMRIEHGLSQQKLADSVGLTRVLVNRQLSSWREQGLVETGRGFVLLRDPEALERFVWADSDPVAHRTGAHLIESEAAEASRRRAEADESGE